MELNPTLWDWELMLFLNNLSPDALDPFWIVVTHTKHWLFLYPFLILIFFYKSSFQKGVLGSLFLFSSVGTAHLFTELTKYLVQRPRPNMTQELMQGLKILYEPTNFSFFSGHASTSFAAIVFIYLTLKSKFNYIGWLFIWPILFSVSRIFVGVHFPSDVIVGAMVGSFIGISYAKLYPILRHRLLGVSNKDNA